MSAVSPSDRAFATRLDRLGRVLDGLYARLGELADEQDAPELGTDPDWLIDMGRRAALTEIRGQLYLARHAVEGAIIGVARARPHARPSRRHDADALPSDDP